MTFIAGFVVGVVVGIAGVVAFIFWITWGSEHEQRRLAGATATTPGSFARRTTRIRKKECFHEELEIDCAGYAHCDRCGERWVASDA